MDGLRARRRPLRERWRGYLAAFGLGLAVAGLIGLVIWWVTSARLADAVGYTYSGLGAVLLLVGGVRGSGYSAGPMRRQTAGTALPDRKGEIPTEPGRGPLHPVRDSVERRRRRLTAASDPTSFWQVMGGAAYLGLGVAITLLWATSA